jgi:hypothetical protein
MLSSLFSIWLYPLEWRTRTASNEREALCRANVTSVSSKALGVTVVTAVGGQLKHKQGYLENDADSKTPNAKWRR